MTSCEGSVKDAQFDYYGTRVAICDTTGKIVIQDIPDVTGKSDASIDLDTRLKANSFDNSKINFRDIFHSGTCTKVKI